MEKYVIFVFCIILASTVAPPPKISKQYRKDYVYNKKTDAFYKLHVEKVSHCSLSNLCEAEGAQLMIPSSGHDILQLHHMFKKFPDLGDYVWVGHDRPIIDLSPAKRQLCAVATRSGDIDVMKCCRKLPFICKVAAQDAPYNDRCDVYGKNYRYYSSAGSCYKIPRIPFIWSQAYSECQAEGAHLLVVNSHAERDAIFNLTNTEETVKITRSWYYPPPYYFAGFRADRPAGNATPVFKTIFNQTLEEAGYSEWSENEPNNEEGREFCGGISKNDGKLNDIDCSYDFGFICEKEVPSSL